MKPNDTLLQNAAKRIIAWYKINKRPLPWREDCTPYHVWISEIMLQQTRIETVIPYYLRFLESFPTLRSLAFAEEEKLMKLWQGLGYYSRARNLKKAAEQIVSSYGGDFPRKAKDLCRLPGIGSYTAGAIASIAFGEPEPAVDGNVLRVLTRLSACKDDISQGKTKNAFTESLRGVYPAGEDAAALTQGLMELGEVICIPNGMPKCEICPLKPLCLAHQNNTVNRYPVKAEKKQRKTETHTVLLLCCGQKYALRRRPEKGLLAGLWEFVNLSGHLNKTQVTDFVQQKSKVLSCVFCGESKHIFTHVQWHMYGFIVECTDEISGFVWETAEEIQQKYAVPSAFRFYLEILQNHCPTANPHRETSE